jgi:hypothetical protein
MMWVLAPPQSLFRWRFSRRCCRISKDCWATRMWEDKLALRMKKADAFLTLLALNFPETQEVIYLVASCRSDADGEGPACLPAPLFGSLHLCCALQFSQFSSHRPKPGHASFIYSSKQANEERLPSLACRCRLWMPSQLSAKQVISGLHRWFPPHHPARPRQRR